jgi:hypothetical protein
MYAIFHNILSFIPMLATIEKSQEIKTIKSALQPLIHSLVVEMRITENVSADQGCQMVCFQTKNPNFGKFWRVLQWAIFYNHLVYFTAIGNILWPFGKFCGHLVYFPRFGILCQQKSGNPRAD